MANFLLLLSSRLAGAVKAYFARVAGDGGVTVSRDHAEEVYNDTIGDDPTLIVSNDSGKATVLYSLFAFSDINAYETRVTADSGTTASTDHVIDVVHAVRNAGLFSESTIFVPCASGKATVLYSLIPN